MGRNVHLPPSWVFLNAPRILHMAPKDKNRCQQQIYTKWLPTRRISIPGHFEGQPEVCFWSFQSTFGLERQVDLEVPIDPPPVKSRKFFQGMIF